MSWGGSFRCPAAGQRANGPTVGAGASYGMRTELLNVDQCVAKIESTMQQLANAVVLTARQNESLIAIERRVDRLE
jgi:hypothetical protein